MASGREALARKPAGAGCLCGEEQPEQPALRTEALLQPQLALPLPMEALLVEVARSGAPLPAPAPAAPPRQGLHQSGMPWLTTSPLLDTLSRGSWWHMHGIVASTTLEWCLEV